MQGTQPRPFAPPPPRPEMRGSLTSPLAPLNQGASPPPAPRPPPRRNKQGDLLLLPGRRLARSKMHQGEVDNKKTKILTQRNIDDMLRAAFAGEWNKVLHILKGDPKSKAPFLPDGEVALIFSAITFCDEEQHFRKLLEIIGKNYTDHTSIAEMTGLTGNITAVKILLDSFPDQIMKVAPDLLIGAAQNGNKECAAYFLSRAYDFDKYNCLCDIDDSASGIISLLKLDLIGPAYHVFCTYSEVLQKTCSAKTAAEMLKILAGKPHLFRSGKKLGTIEGFIYNFISVNKEDKPSFDFVNSTGKKVKQARETKLMHLHADAMLDLVCKPYENTTIFDDNAIRYQEQLHEAATIAAKEGNYEVLLKIFKLFPLVWAYREEEAEKHVFSHAASHRHAKTFSLFYLYGPLKASITASTDNQGCILLHHVAKQAAPNCLLGSGPVIQMQREIQWFQVVESLTQSTKLEHRSRKKQEGKTPNELSKEEHAEGKTPKELFKEEHAELKEKAEKTLKSTSQSGTVVAALVATVAFAAAFTVPGGNNQETGIPIFLGKLSFMVFAIFDALSLFFSVTSAMAFTGVLISPTAEEDFAFALPLKLVIALISLVISAACMMASFCAALHIVLSHKVNWIIAPISVVSVIPVLFYLSLQLPFVVELLRTTFYKDHLPSPDKVASPTRSNFVAKMLKSHINFVFGKKSRPIDQQSVSKKRDDSELV